MHGNVWELCLDTIRPGDVLNGSIDPIGAKGVYDYRGGDWSSFALWCQSGTSQRNYGCAYESVGFRLAITYP
jgi:formylglycine-generating enzyme required for sulfatase activity